MTKVMRELRKLYVEDNMDVLNFRILPSNPLTYHHVIERWELEALGFSKKQTVENGLPLTRIGHRYLHLIERFDSVTYSKIRKIILLITKERRLPTLEERELIQFYLDYFEYEIKEYYSIDKKYFKRVRKIKE